jgi:hypothetical protein
MVTGQACLIRRLHLCCRDSEYSTQAAATLKLARSRRGLARDRLRARHLRSKSLFITMPPTPRSYRPKRGGMSASC